MKFLIFLIAITSSYAQMTSFNPGDIVDATLLNQNFSLLNNLALSKNPNFDFTNFKIFADGEIVRSNDINQNFTLLSQSLPHKNLSNSVFTGGSFLIATDLNNLFGEYKDTLELPEYPFDPVDGDVVIASGETLTLTVGDVKRYNSLEIQSGGTIQIVGSNPNAVWSNMPITEIAVLGDFILNGTIVGNGNFPGATINYTSQIVSELVINGSIDQAPGGSGGNGQENPGGSQGFGNGGGGGAPDVAFVGNSIHSPQATSGGINNVGSGGCSINPADGFTICGGSGGFRGNHGHSLILIVNGSITGSGSINLSGTNGNGGGSPSQFNNGGAGGGGGAGGSSGILYVKSYSPIDVNIAISTNGGSGGSGAPNFAGFSSPGASGSSGSSYTPILDDFTLCPAPQMYVNSTCVNTTP